MYRILIHDQEGNKLILELETEKRKLARAAYELCQENELKCAVVEDVQPRPVKFKGLD